MGLRFWPVFEVIYLGLVSHILAQRGKSFSFSSRRELFVRDRGEFFQGWDYAPIALDILQLRLLPKRLGEELSSDPCEVGYSRSSFP